MPLRDKEARAAYQRAYSERNRASLNEYTARWRRERYASDPVYQEKVKATTRAVPKHVHAAQMRVYKAIKRGELIRPEVCSQCGGGGFIEAAHENYHERLAVVWLCRSCHRAWDCGNPKITA